MSMSIRPLEANDRARWEELFRAYAHFYDAKIDDRVIDLTWRRLLGGEDGFYGLVAVDDAAGLMPEVSLRRPTMSELVTHCLRAAGTPPAPGAAPASGAHPAPDTTPAPATTSRREES